MDKVRFKNDFEYKLREVEIKYQSTSEGYYNISPKNRIVQPIKIRLIVSKPINPIIHGSQNGNAVDAIGYFRFKLLPPDQESDYIAFAFHNLKFDFIEYMIVPTHELRNRLKKNVIRYMNGEYFEFRLWRMMSNLYDTTNLGLEAEWFYLSVGDRGGRMIDQTEWNYTTFLNNWILGFRE